MAVGEQQWPDMSFLKDIKDNIGFRGICVIFKPFSGRSIPVVRMHGVHVDRVRFPAARPRSFELSSFNG